jgi:hypothetical protein
LTTTIIEITDGRKEEKRMQERNYIHQRGLGGVFGISEY